jgi:DNA anti-recombination protein RmuC
VLILSAEPYVCIDDICRLACTVNADVQGKLLEKHRELSRRFNDKLSQLEASYGSKLQSLRERASESRVALERESKQFRASLQALEKAHDDRLNAINAEVKHDLARKDEELDTMRDAVQTEKVKLAKLKKLLSRYQ